MHIIVLFLEVEDDLDLLLEPDLQKGLCMKKYVGIYSRKESINTSRIITSKESGNNNCELCKSDRTITCTYIASTNSTVLSTVVQKNVSISRIEFRCHIIDNWCDLKYLYEVILQCPSRGDILSWGFTCVFINP